MEVFDARGKGYRLSPTSASGGEGSIFRVEASPLLAVKIFHPHRLTSELRQKLDVMLTYPPPDAAFEAQAHRSITWPLALAFKDPSARNMVGYVMRWVDTDFFKHAHTYYDSADRIRRFGGLFTWQHLLTTATNVASAVAAMHTEGHRVGDLRDSNVLVAPNSLVSLIDCDSFQILDRQTGRVFPTRVGAGEFLPPEIQGADLGSKAIDRYHSDLFALAVLVFKFLMLGAHPHQARGGAAADLASIEAKIQAGIYAFGSRPVGGMPPKFAPSSSVLSSPLRRLAERAFVDGHAHPERRPTADQWFEALSRQIQDLRVCKANTNHVFGKHLRRCPWCTMAPQGDPFPSTPRIGVQIAASPPQDAASLSDRRAHLASYVEMALVDGALSQEEQQHINRLGAALGLHRSEVEGVIRGKQAETKVKVRTGAAKSQPNQPPKKRTLQELKALMATHGTEEPPPRADALTIAKTIAGGAGVASIAWLVPLAALIGVILVVTPALACASEINKRRKDGSTSLAIFGSMLTRIPQSEIQTIYHLIPAATYSALPVAWIYFALTRWLDLSPPTAARSLLTACSAAWVLWIGILETREPYMRDVRFGSGLLTMWLASRLKWPTALPVAVAVLVGTCIWMGLQGTISWWPLSQPPPLP